MYPLFDRIKSLCQGRHWPLRLVMWLWFLYLAVQCARDPEYTGLLGGINLGIHEFGHLITMPFGQTICVAGGSAVQCLVPLISIGMFLKQEDLFALSFSFVWLATNLFGVARYMADASAMELPLVTPFSGEGGEVIHDWNFLLNQMGLLDYDTRIAGVVQFAGWCSFALGIAWGAFILFLMISLPKEDQSPA
ncbi:MAG: hypothetical protein SFY92_04290 [Verrucomicrobiae bacterium]|nr:hypothetical protein [Verrucomicrobiae bacterium]